MIVGLFLVGWVHQFNLIYFDGLVKGSPPLRNRKASLDRILSPRTIRKSYANASPAEMTREKSLSPVQSGTVQPLCTSMSNASIHSNYSDDSLMAASSASSAQRFNSPSSRWNNVNLNNANVVDCYNSLPCGNSLLFLLAYSFYLKSKTIEKETLKKKQAEIARN